MGYELHITRREFHEDDTGPEISSEEWLALVEADAELEPKAVNGPYFAKFLGDCRYGRGQGWFDWSNGCVSTKNPDEAILAKMLALAEALDAKVQGDDGEIYVAPDFETGFVEPTPPAYRSSFFRRVFDSLYDLVHRPVNRLPLPFDVGDRVRDVWGNQATVTEIDHRAESGLGRITVCYDDGRVSHLAVSAHGLEKAPSLRNSS